MVLLLKQGDQLGYSLQKQTKNTTPNLPQLVNGQQEVSTTSATAASKEGRADRAFTAFGSAMSLPSLFLVSRR